MSIRSGRLNSDDVFVNMAAAININYTHSVRVFVAPRGGINPLERLLRAEIAELFRRGLPSANHLIVHTVSWRGDHNIMLSGTDHGMSVDLCGHESATRVSQGDFAGLPILVPVPLRFDD